MTVSLVTRPNIRMIFFNAVLIAVLSTATIIGLGATTGPNQPSSTPNIGNPGVSYTVPVPAPSTGR